jgi:hypothetical protein
MTPLVLLPNQDNRILFSPLDSGRVESQGDGPCALARNRRELELLLLCLGERSEVILDERLPEMQPETWKWLQGRDPCELLAEARWNYKEGAELIPVLENIPIPECIRKAERAGLAGGARMEQAYVHKLHPGNVLIAPLGEQGRIQYFEGFADSTEFNIDHPSDHVEGIVVFETLRQTAIASIHLAGLPLEGRSIMLDAVLKYNHFVDGERPFFIRTIAVVRASGGNGYTVFELVQGEHSCVSGIFKSFSFKNREAYLRFTAGKVTT